jgi:hypothetical protein
MRSTASVILVGAAGLLTACNSEQSGAITSPDGETAEYRVDEATGETTMTITTAEGKASLRSGSRVPVQLPQGFSLYPGSEVLTSTVVNQPDGVGTMVMFQTDARGPQIIAHFKDEAERAGFKIEMEATMNGTVMLGGKRATDGASFMINTGPYEEGKTTGQLVIGNSIGG